jgi:RNA polymerase sigma-70 factor (ECF subfamily)
MDAQKEDELVGKSKQGDMQAFAELVDIYKARIYRTAYAMTRNHQDSDDLAQETFMLAYKSLKFFKGKSSFYTWLYRIAVNSTLNHLKKMNKEKSREPFLQEQVLQNPDTSESPERESLAGELRRRLTEAIDSLPVVYKSSFVLVAFQGMSHGQAARILKCSENTVSWRMHRARKMLQIRLSPYLKR